ncbi:T-cell surface glycoprotein CD8 beta chain-like [Maylandia zebra]|uniref:T-cell surface glycoprotein CD8 beta chain-like n=1 Tax=Maylandia zebra TaxID=106582 RepID=UPI00403CDD1D
MPSSFLLLSSANCTLLANSTRGWLSVSGSEFQTVEVQSGEEVTLQCSNISRSSTHTEWFRVVNRATLSCIASMYGSNGQALFCDGFQNGKFNMTSNNVAVFLQIKPVDLSDAGLYFCGFFLDYHIIISTRVELRIQGDGKTNHTVNLIHFLEEFNRTTQPLSIILAGLTGLLSIVVIVLVLKVRKPQTDCNTVTLSNLMYHG